MSSKKKSARSAYFFAEGLQEKMRIEVAEYWRLVRYYETFYPEEKPIVTGKRKAKTKKKGGSK